MQNNEQYSLSKKYKFDIDGNLKAQYRIDNKGDIIVRDDVASSISSKKKYSRLEKFFGNDYAELRPEQKRHNVICTIAGLLAVILMVAWLIWVVSIVIFGEKSEKEDPQYYIDTEWTNPWEDFVDIGNDD